MAGQRLGAGPGEKYLPRGNRMVPSLAGRGLMRDPEEIGQTVIVPEWAYCAAEATSGLHLSEEERASLLRGLLADEGLRLVVVAVWALAPEVPRHHRLGPLLAVREALRVEGLLPGWC